MVECEKNARMAYYSTDEINDGCVSKQKRMRARLDKTKWLWKIMLCITQVAPRSACLASSMI